MKLSSGGKIDFKLIRWMAEKALFEAQCHIRALDPATKLFRSMVAFTCFFSLLLLWQIGHAQGELVRKARMVQQWRITATPAVSVTPGSYR